MRWSRRHPSNQPPPVPSAWQRLCSPSPWGEPYRPVSLSAPAESPFLDELCELLDLNFLFSDRFAKTCRYLFVHKLMELLLIIGNSFHLFFVLGTIEVDTRTESLGLIKCFFAAFSEVFVLLWPFGRGLLWDCCSLARVLRLSPFCTFVRFIKRYSPL